MKLELRKSSNPKKKYMMTFIEDNKRSKTTHFGATGYSDRTTTKNPTERKKKYTAYQSRHRGDNLTDMKSAGALSWYILWSADTLAGGIKKYENRFNVNVKKI
tara:strand:+ start:299 stop:607 length:309 start_codon:yes stop_codon:yes gene_type:complete